MASLWFCLWRGYKTIKFFGSFFLYTAPKWVIWKVYPKINNRNIIIFSHRTTVKLTISLIWSELRPTCNSSHVYYSLILLHLLAWHVTRPFIQRHPRLLKLKRYTRIKLLTKFSGSFNEGNLLGEHFFCGEPFTAPSGQASDEPTTSVDTEASEIKMACMVQTLCSDVCLLYTSPSPRD